MVSARAAVLRLASASSLTRATAGGVPSNVVDVYNVATGAWSTAQLRVARVFRRYSLAAASVGNVALFAGGASPCALLCRGGWDMFIIVVYVFCVLCVLQYCGSVCPSTAFSYARFCR